MPISREHFTAEDNDTRPEEIVYTVSEAPVNGYFAIGSAPAPMVSNFTQAQVDEMLVVFVHQGGKRSQMIDHLSICAI